MQPVKSSTEEFYIHRKFRMVAAAVCFLIVVFQAFIIDYYLIIYMNAWWSFWVVCDIAVSFVFIACFIYSFRHMKMTVHHRRANKEMPAKGSAGELPLGYITWFIYSLFLSIRVGIIFKSIAFKLSDEEFFGPNVLQSGLALSSIIFLLLILTHADTTPRTPRDLYIQNITLHVTLDILDTVTILELLFITETRVVLTFALQNTVIVVGCINLVLPTLPFIVLSYTRYGKDELPVKISMIHTLVYLIAVNFPLLIIRVVLWHIYDENISVFIIKNVLALVATIKTVLENIADMNSMTQRERADEKALDVEDMLPKWRIRPATASAADM